VNSPYFGDAFQAVKGASGLIGAAKRPIFVFQCYLDDSGTSGLPIVTMAGFLAGMDHWEYLEPKLDAIIRRHGVDILHAKEFYSTRPPFDGWSRVRKRSFAEEVFSTAHGRYYGLSVTVSKDGLEKSRNNGLLPNMSPIGVCFSAIVMRLVTNPAISQAVLRDGVAFLIESGNKNNPGIEQFFHKMSKEPVFKGALRSISFIAKGSCRAIQLADFFAFFSRRHMRNHARFGGRLALPSCAYLDIIRKHGPVWEQGGHGEPQFTGTHLENLTDLSELRALVTKPRGA
jgi:hypothetical protein